jgi:hypothetical protein
LPLPVYPSMARYLALLPGGLDAYPRAQAKGAILRMALEEERLKLPLETLPAQLAAHYTTPPTVNAWIPEVHLNAWMLAVFDAHFTAAGGTAVFEQWIFERNRKLFRTPLFRILFAVASPERILVGIEKRWAAFRRGSEMRLAGQTSTSAELSFHHPKHMASDLSARGLKMALRAALELAGAREVAMTYLLAAPDETRFTASWAK